MTHPLGKRDWSRTPTGRWRTLTLLVVMLNLLYEPIQAYLTGSLFTGVPSGGVQELSVGSNSPFVGVSFKDSW